MPMFAADPSCSRGIGISETLGLKELRRLLSEGVP
jgi:hypothetical protein